MSWLCCPTKGKGKQALEVLNVLGPFLASCKMSKSSNFRCSFPKQDKTKPAKNIKEIQYFHNQIDHGMKSSRARRASLT